jgi:predicted small secreted protein
MKNLTLKLNCVLNILNSKTGRLVILVVVLSLFILSAGAPNAMIGIGK